MSSRGGTKTAVITLLLCLFALPARPAAVPSDRFDGPAELPRVFVQSSLADTPALGSVRTVKEGENLQEALDNLRCGDTLKLQAGATFQGLFRFPALSCDDSHWIIVRTSAPDDALPPEGTRLTPCYAGVASLPGRPDFHCSSSSPANVLARIEFDGKSGSGPLLLQNSANHYRFVGLEITRTDSPASVTALAFTKDDATANHIIFDRVWFHGTAQSETRRGVALSGMTYSQ